MSLAWKRERPQGELANSTQWAIRVRIKLGSLVGSNWTICYNMELHHQHTNLVSIFNMKTFVLIIRPFSGHGFFFGCSVPSARKPARLVESKLFKSTVVNILWKNILESPEMLSWLLYSTACLLKNVCNISYSPVTWHQAIAWHAYLCLDCIYFLERSCNVPDQKYYISYFASKTIKKSSMSPPSKLPPRKKLPFPPFIGYWFLIVRYTDIEYRNIFDGKWWLGVEGSSRVGFA